MWQVWHKLGNKRCPENKNEKKKMIKRQKNMTINIKNLMKCATIAVREGIWVRTVRHGSIVIIESLRKMKELLMGMRMIYCWFRWCMRVKKNVKMKKFGSQRIPGSKTLVHHAISPTTILAYMTSPTSASQSMVSLVICPLPKRASSKSRCSKSMGLNRSIYYGLWSFAPRQVQTCFPWCAIFCRETRLQVTIETILGSILQQAILSLIAELRLVMVGLQESISYVKTRGQYLLQSYPSKTSTTFTLS